MLNHVKLRSLLSVEVLFRVFWQPFGYMLQKSFLFGHFWKPLGHLGHQKSPKGGPKTPKGLPEVTKKGAFLEHVAKKAPKKHKKTLRHLTVKPF